MSTRAVQVDDKFLLTVPEAVARERLLLSIDEARELLGGIARSYVYVLIAKGDIAAVRVGRRRLIAMRDLEAYVERLRSEGGVA